MFSRVEVRTLLSITITAIVAMQSGLVWGAGGLITTALAFYVLLGSAIYSVLVLVYSGIVWLVRKAKGNIQPPNSDCWKKGARGSQE